MHGTDSKIAEAGNCERVRGGGGGGGGGCYFAPIPAESGGLWAGDWLSKLVEQRVRTLFISPVREQILTR